MLRRMNDSSNATAVIPAQPKTPDLAQLLVELDKSGMSTSAFAREHGLPAWKLYYALKARAKLRTPKPAIIPVRVTNATDRSTPLELVLSGGHRLLVPTNFDESSLRRLMGVLAGC